MADRISEPLTWSQCIALTKKMNSVQEAVINYTASGMPAEGLHNDRYSRICLIDLRNYINRVLNSNKYRSLLRDVGRAVALYQTGLNYDIVDESTGNVVLDEDDFKEIEKILKEIVS